MNDEQKAQLQEARTIQLEAGQKYIIIFDRSTITRSDVAGLAKLISEEGATGIMVALNGDPGSIQVIKAPEEDADAPGADTDQ